MSTIEVITLIFTAVGMTAGLAAYAHATFLTRREGNSLERGVQALINYTKQLAELDMGNIKHNMSDLKKRVENLEQK